MAESHGEAKRTGAHTGAEGGQHSGAFPPFDSSTFPSQLVSLVVFFVALYIIVSRFALPRVGAVIDARQNKIEGDLAEAQKLKDESEAALKAYESDLAKARSKAQAIGAETREKLNAASEAERKSLEDKLAARLADAEKSIAATRADRDEQCARHRGRCRRAPSCSASPVLRPTARRWKPRSTRR